MRFQSALLGQTRTVLILSKAPHIKSKDLKGSERHYYKLALLIEAKTPRTATSGQSPIDLSTHEPAPQSADHGSLFDLQSQPADLKTLTNRGMSSATAGIADTSQNPATWPCWYRQFEYSDRANRYNSTAFRPEVSPPLRLCRCQAEQFAKLFLQVLYVIALSPPLAGRRDGEKSLQSCSTTLILSTDDKIRSTWKEICPAYQLLNEDSIDVDVVKGP